MIAIRNEIKKHNLERIKKPFKPRRIKMSKEKREERNKNGILSYVEAELSKGRIDFSQIVLGLDHKDKQFITWEEFLEWF